MTRYDVIRVTRNTDGPWPYTAHGYDRDPADGELVHVNACDGDTAADARRELTTERKPT